MSDPKTYVCDGVRICELCMEGNGGECHTAGCVFWLNRAPEMAIDQTIRDFGGTIEEAREYAERKGWYREECV